MALSSGLEGEVAPSSGLEGVVAPSPGLEGVVAASPRLEGVPRDKAAVLHYIRIYSVQCVVFKVRCAMCSVQ